jgi:hypothetical protein
MWRAANENESRHDQLPVACSVSICLCHARFETLPVRASARHLIDRQLRRARTSRVLAGTSSQNRLERKGVTSSGACLEPPSDTDRSVASKFGHIGVGDRLQ